jgi:hypothetical protein
MKVVPQKYRLVFRLSSIFFPLTEPDFSDLLKEKGYTVGHTVPPIFPAGQRAYLSGRIATRDDCVVEVDADRKLIVCEGRSPREVADVIEELMLIARKKFHVNFRRELRYVELVAHLIVTSEKNPLRSVTDFFKKCVSLKRFDKVLGTNTSLLTVAIVPEGVPPNSNKWFDIGITPHFTASSREYYVSVVFRDQETKKALDFTRQINTMIMNLVKEIERD